MNGHTSLADILGSARDRLVDQSLRSSLLNLPTRLPHTLAVEITAPNVDRIYSQLVDPDQGLDFARSPHLLIPGPVAAPDDPVAHRLPVPVDRIPDPVIDDGYLHTAHPDDELQRRLVRLDRAARTAEQECGTSTLYLVLGVLEWSPDEERHFQAPLLLMPTVLRRDRVGQRLRLEAASGEVMENPGLRIRLRDAFGIELPEVTVNETRDPGAYFAAVRECIGPMEAWQVRQNRIVLRNLPVRDLILYHDLDPGHWAGNSKSDFHARLRRILAADTDPDDAREAGDSGETGSSGVPVAGILPMDSSQAGVLEAARRGEDLVVEGPPGNGKSTVAANLVADAVCRGGTVAIVVAKTAAKNVAKAKLSEAGLGDLCLDLHSCDMPKAAFYADLAGAQALVEAPPARLPDIEPDLEEIYSGLVAALDNHTQMMAAKHAPSGRSCYDVVSRLIAHREAGRSHAAITLPAASTWPAATYARNLDCFTDAARSAQRLGIPSVFPWRSARLKSVLPTSIARWKADLEGVRAEVGSLATAVSEWNRLVERHEPQPVQCLLAGIDRVRRLQACPEAWRRAVASPAWEKDRANIDRLIDALKTIRAFEERTAMENLTIDWTTAFEDLAIALAPGQHFGEGWASALWRRRQAKSALQRALGRVPPRDPYLTAAFAETLARTQAAKHAVAEGDDLGRQAFGAAWQDLASNLHDFEGIADIAATIWDTADGPAIANLCRTGDVGNLARVGDRMEALWYHIDRVLGSIFDESGFLIEEAVGAADLAVLTVEDLAGHVDRWVESVPLLGEWIRYHADDRELRQQGMDEAADAVFAGAVDPAQARAHFCMAYHEALLADFAEQFPELTAFHGQIHARQAGQYRALDAKRTSVLQGLILQTWRARAGTFGGRADLLARVRRETAKRRGQTSIRRFIGDLGSSILTLKPIVLLSPTSLAKFFGPGRSTFDLIVFDEASQMRTEEALGSVLRSRQVVVMGDSNQMPPTSFFKSDNIGSDSAMGDDDDAHRPVSLLDQSRQAGLPAYELTWHYRARHPALMLTVNRHVYGGRLQVPPSPGNQASDIGLRVRSVEAGHYDRGGTATNPYEAGIVADAMIAHAERHPGRSLGVAAFSAAQQSAIEDALERRLAAMPEAPAFFDAGGSEPLFIKNLENVQGDERDEIFLSLGYGRDPDGGLPMNFGPVSAIGGEKRLNVMITRARLRCTVFTELTSSDIDIDRCQGRGPALLKAYLEAAEAADQPGTCPIDEDMEQDGFVVAINRVVEAEGFYLAGPAGAGQPFIDYVVRSSENQDRAVLGIILDHPDYAAVMDVRDRERVRHDVLTARDWTFYRVSALDWLSRPGEEADRLRRALRESSDFQRNPDLADVKLLPLVSDGSGS